MTRRQKHMILTGVGAFALVLVAAGAGAFVSQRMDDTPEANPVAKSEQIVWDEPRAEPKPQQQAQASCDDANVVGAAIGAVAGGFAGNQVGDGRGKDLATVGGAIGGGYLGQQYIPTRNVLCP